MKIVADGDDLKCSFLDFITVTCRKQSWFSDLRITKRSQKTPSRTALTGVGEGVFIYDSISSCLSRYSCMKSTRSRMVGLK